MSSMPPQNQPGHDTNQTTDGARRNPLGFADVRAADAPATDLPAVSAIGFVQDGTAPSARPTMHGAPQYRTEISFRRDGGHAAVRAESAPGYPSNDGAGEPPALGLGHVRAVSFDQEPVAAEAADVADPVDAAGEKVPFYKREISFGRKREVGVASAQRSEQPAVEPVVAAAQPTPSEAKAEAEAVPFFKRELSFRRRRGAVADTQATEPAVEPSAEPVVVDLSDTVEPAATVLHEEPVAPAAEAVVWAVADDADEVAEALEVADLVEAADPVVELADPVALADELAALGVADQPMVDMPMVDELVLEPVADLGLDDPIVAVEDDPYAFPADDVVTPAATYEDEPAVVDFDFDVDREPQVADEVVADASDAPGEDVIAAAAPAEKKRDKAGRRSTRLSVGGSKAPKKSGNGGGKGRGRARKMVGLKIGASQIAAAVVLEQNGNHELLKVVRAPLPAGMVVAGEIKDVAGLATELRRLFDDNDLPRQNVRLGVASNRIGVRTFDIEGIDDNERFDNAVRFKAHEVLPVAFHESVLDYRVVAERPTENGESVKTVLLVVAPRDQVEPYIQVCAAADIRLTAVDLEALGLLRAFVEPQPVGSRVSDDTATVLVSLGHDATSLLVAGAGVCDFTRVFDWGGGLLETAISSELEVSRERAAEILRHLSLEGPGTALEGLSDDDRAAATRVVRSRLTPFARELVSSLHFYQTQPDSLGIGEILITGGTSHLDGLAGELNKLIGVAVRHGDPLARVVPLETPDDDLVQRFGSVTVPIGLAIEDAPWRTVNLLPAELRPSRKPLDPVKVGVPALAVVSLAALGFMFFNAHGKVGEQQSRLDAVRAEIAALPEPKRATIDPALQGAEAARAQAVAQVLGGRLVWERLFSDISRVLPANVWFDSLTVDGTNAFAQPVVALPGTPEAAPTAVRIQGYTFTQPDVALFLARLQAMPTLKRVTLELAESTEQTGKTVTKFSIIADLNGGTQ